MGDSCPGVVVEGVIIQRKISGDQKPGGQLLWEEFRGGNCPGGRKSGGNCPGGNFIDRNCPVGSCLKGEFSG